MKTILLIFYLALSLSSLAGPLVVHEWGTFTSFMGSDGRLQQGLHREEEPLPSFVYGFGNSQRPIFNQPNLPFPNQPIDNCPDFPTKVPCDFLFNLSENNLSSGFGSLEIMPQNPLSAGVTQKMETPVIYFYGEPESKVKVTVDFPQGVISQYYPRASQYSPKYDQVTTLGPSSFTWDVILKDEDFVGRTPKVFADSIWAPSRQVNANTIEVEGENEKFIFYRGVADFKADFKVESNLKDQLIISNLSDEAVTAAFVLQSDGETGIIKTLGGISKSLVVQKPILAEGVPQTQFIQQAKTLIAQALVQYGMYLDEAMALVNTWEKSYFHTPGLRVLYLVPKKVTERILPLTITPQPQSVVRALVGRVEIMTAKEEQQFLTQLSNPELNVNVHHMFGRFYEPKLRRLLSLTTTIDDLELQALLQGRIQNLLKSNP